MKKVVDGVTTEYRMAGSLLVSERTGDETIWYQYDSAASLVAMIIGGTRYNYVRNAQNDIIGLLDSTGKRVVSYKYNSWGKTVSITGTLAATVGQKNPFRYRGYYFDAESGMYYLQSRYYDPEIRRFISADDVTTVITVNAGLNYQNLYTYCSNEPIGRYDENGYFSLPNWAKVAIGAVTTVAAVGVTVATGGFVLPVIASVAVSTAVGTGIGYITGGKSGALDGAADGFMWGGIGSFTGSTIEAVSTVHEYRGCIDTYRNLRKEYRGSGKEVHHIIEQRIYKDALLKSTLKEMPSIALDKTTHRVYTNAWRQEMAYGTRYRDSAGFRWILYKCSNKVYKNSRILRMAARRIIYTRWY